MKRELKALQVLAHPFPLSTNCKAHPDEKGTERDMRSAASVPESWIARPIPMKRELKVYSPPFVFITPFRYCKAHPDEKGTERKTLSAWYPSKVQYCKAHPDEKGTERPMMYFRGVPGGIIARPIPMKRELKGAMP